LPRTPSPRTLSLAPGIATPKKELELVKERLTRAEMHYAGWIKKST